VQAPSPATSDAARIEGGIEPTNSPAPLDGAFNISAEETTRRLRTKGQPIRLFGEGDKERRLRLRALELIEEKGHERHGGQNDFKKALEEVESRERELKAQEGSDKSKKREQPAASGSGEALDLGLLKTDKSKLYPLIYHALKRILKEWEEAMDDRPDSVKQTTQGKLAGATQKQSAEYLKPLFKILRSRVRASSCGLILVLTYAQDMPDDVLGRISEIVHYTQKRQYQRANDAYLRLSIGNAPWPIGVTMVG
jgi:pre-mRNA-splicing factor 18